jgi:hypothetical protein
MKKMQLPRHAICHDATAVSWKAHNKQKRFRTIHGGVVGKIFHLVRVRPTCAWNHFRMKMTFAQIKVSTFPGVRKQGVKAANTAPE